MEPDDLLCSRNARLKKSLVGRAQWKINQPPSLKIERASLDGAFISLTRALEDRPGYAVKSDLFSILPVIGVCRLKWYCSDGR